MGQKIAPALLDLYLAKTGFQAPQSGQRVDPDRLDNLYQPRDGDGGADHGAHGIFDDQSLSYDPQPWLSRRPYATSITGAAAAALGLAAAVAQRRRN